MLKPRDNLWVGMLLAFTLPAFAQRRGPFEGRGPVLHDRGGSAGFDEVWGPLLLLLFGGLVVLFIANGLWWGAVAVFEARSKRDYERKRRDRKFKFSEHVERGNALV